MQISYEKKNSALDIGDGLFAKQFVPTGTLVWKYTAGVNVLVYDGKAATNRLANVPTLEMAQNWLDMTYGLNGFLHEILDDGKYMNHSETPNCKTRENGDTYALRDILTGEQLFEDYTSFGKKILTCNLRSYINHELQLSTQITRIFYSTYSRNMTVLPNITHCQTDTTLISSTVPRSLMGTSLRRESEVYLFTALELKHSVEFLMLLTINERLPVY